MNNDLLEKLLNYSHIRFNNGNYKNKNDTCIIWPFFHNNIFKKIIYKSFDYTIKGISKNITNISVITDYLTQDYKNIESISSLQYIYDNYKNNLQETLDNYTIVNKLINELNQKIGKYTSFLNYEYIWIFKNGTKIIIHKYLNPNLETIQLHYDGETPCNNKIDYINSNNLFLFLQSNEYYLNLENSTNSGKLTEKIEITPSLDLDNNISTNKLVNGERTITRDELIKNYKNLFVSMSVPKHKRILAQSCKIDNPYKDL